MIARSLRVQIVEAIREKADDFNAQDLRGMSAYQTGYILGIINGLRMGASIADTLKQKMFYTCPVCKYVTDHPGDVEIGYCPKCTRYNGTDEV